MGRAGIMFNLCPVSLVKAWWCRPVSGGPVCLYEDMHELAECCGQDTSGSRIHIRVVVPACLPPLQVAGVQGLFRDLGGLGAYMSSVVQLVVFAPDFGFELLPHFLSAIADRIPA